MIKLTDILQEILEEKKADRCKRIADRKYSKPSAYKSGAIVRCRQGKIWKDLKEEIDPKEAYENFSGLQTIIDNKRNVGFFPLEGTENKNKFWNLVGTNNLKSLRVSANPYDAHIIYRPGSEKEAYELKSLADKYEGFLANKDPEDTRKIGQLLGYNPTSVEQFVKSYYKLDEAKKETLRTWFKRKGAPGKVGGWIDCNTCRNGKCKPCGRKKGEVRAKYPSCRPTPAQCKRPGKGKTWGKTKLEENQTVNSQFVKDFLVDFGTLVSLNFSQITKMGKDENATKELTLMMQELRKPKINGKNYFDFIKDNINSVPNNPKLLSAVLGIIRDFLIYIEPRVKQFVKDGPTSNGVDYKKIWLERIKKIKEDYNKIIK